jgi:abortive infection bacteriophage resistance protein
MKYPKPPLSIADQIVKLKQRGLTFGDERKAAHYLSNISYYRLRAYTYPFQDNSDPNHTFIKEVSFENIIELYVFDRRLRLLVFNAIEKIEIALRTKIVYEFSLNNGSHWHEDANMYRNNYYFNKNINSLYEEVDRSSETFIEHYKQTYTNPAYPPAWMTLEVITMGLLSKLYGNLQKGNEKKKVANEFGLSNPLILESWMHAFAGLRNICAHHSRLWNRRFTIVPKIPYNTAHTFISNTNIYDNKLYAQLCCINYITRIISPDSSFVPDLKDLLETCTLIDCKDMGFPADWEKETIWQ